MKRGGRLQLNDFPGIFDAKAETWLSRTSQLDHKSLPLLSHEIKFSLPGFHDQSFRFIGSPVPEPATWAMMIVGFASVGLALRRRPRVRDIRQVA